MKGLTINADIFDLLLFQKATVPDLTLDKIAKEAEERAQMMYDFASHQRIIPCASNKSITDTDAVLALVSVIVVKKYNVPYEFSVVCKRLGITPEIAEEKLGKYGLIHQQKIAKTSISRGVQEVIQKISEYNKNH